MITVTRNAQNTIGRCIESVVAQNYSNLEYIVIDGASTDDTLRIISQYSFTVSHLVSEPDTGIYDAMNKGICLATGDVIGVLNADDFFAADDILNSTANIFNETSSDIIYGNLNYLKPDGKVLRRWQSGSYRYGMFNWGWMPPHPTFYCRRAIFETLGNYEVGYGTAADYELMLRFLHLNRLNAGYLNKVMVNMVTGGVSNKNYRNRLLAWKNDFKAMGKNGVSLPLICIIFKPLRKIFQYI
ncbi:glycosyltransferase family 2 protein [Mucilaginibacter panaciglaebae]|uniref:glycosyltransferase family 2 protein n=1 Tax=Mucilaginibacter panaciglaebae TaxID=502331 RepID=UPI0031E6EA89